MRTYTLGEIVQYVPTLTKRQVQHYSAEGLIKPLERTTGTGQPRQYPREALVNAALIGALVKLHVGIATIKKIISMNPFPTDKDGNPIIEVQLEVETIPCGEKTVRDLYIFVRNGMVVRILPQTSMVTEEYRSNPGMGTALASYEGFEYDALLYLNLEKTFQSLPK